MSEPTAQQIVAGGESVPVVFRDGSTRAVFVSQLRPLQLPAYNAAELINELGPLEIVTGLKPEELNELSLSSLEQLLEADLRQNFSYARRYAKRRAEAAARQFEAMRECAPEEFSRMVEKIEKQLLASINSSPASLPTPAGQPPGK